LILASDEAILAYALYPKLASLFKATASSFSEFNASGAPFNKLFNCVFTKLVVA
jgi:hypothetical protein